jgi:hypothetical protein
MGCWLWLRCGRSDACFAGGGTTGLHCRTQPLNRIRLGCIWDIEIHGPQSRLCARTPAAITTGIPQTPDSGETSIIIDEAQYAEAFGVY